MKNTFFNILKQLGRAIKFLISFILLATFVLLISATLIVRGGAKTIQSSTYVDTLLQNQQVFEQGRMSLTQFIMSYALFKRQSTWSMGDLSPGAWQDIMQSIAPEDWSRHIIKGFSLAVIKWLDNPDAMFPDFTLTLLPVKDNLNSAQGMLTILPILQELPACEQSITSFKYHANGLVDCIPQKQDLSVAGSLMAKRLSESLPFQVSLKQLYEQGFLPSTWIGLALQVRAMWFVVWEVIGLGMRLSLLILCVYVLLNASTPIRLFRSTATALLGAGGFLLIIVAAVKWGSIWGINAQTLVISDLKLDMQTLNLFLKGASLQFFISNWFYPAVVLVGSGMGLLLLSQVFKIIENRMSKRITSEERKKYRQIKQSYR